jgi:predicted small integral membrane protein
MKTASPKLKFKCRNGGNGWMGLLERLIFKVTSGRFIFTVVVAGVYAYLACAGLMEENRINEITLIVLYAYFNRPRVEPVQPAEDKEDEK